MSAILAVTADDLQVRGPSQFLASGCTATGHGRLSDVVRSHKGGQLAPTSSNSSSDGHSGSAEAWPEQARISTKVQIALELATQAIDAKIPGGLVLADSGYGDTRPFRAGIKALGLQYSVDVKQHTLGLDHFKGRSYRGWPHHVSTVLTCYAFAVAAQAQVYLPKVRSTQDRDALPVAA